MQLHCFFKDISYYLEVYWSIFLNTIKIFNLWFSKQECSQHDHLIIKFRKSPNQPIDVRQNVTISQNNFSLLHLRSACIFQSVYVWSLDVQITLACTGKMSGFAAFRLHVDIRREFEGLRKIPHINFVAQKYCLSRSKCRFIWYKPGSTGFKYNYRIQLFYSFRKV